MFDHVKLSSFGLSKTSPRRKVNEDAYLLMDRTFAIADGMGGHNAGAIASQSAIQYLKTLRLKTPNTRYRLEALTEIFTDYFHKTNTHVYELSQQKTNLTGMGTTFLSLLFDGRFVLHGHVGDSRLYRLRANQLSRLTSDHTVYRDSLTKKSSLLTKKHVLTKALGAEAVITPTIGAQVAFPKDRYLLCSDGLTDVLSDDTIKNHLLNPDLKTTCQNLINAATKAKSTDDITVIVVQIEFPDN